MGTTQHYNLAFFDFNDPLNSVLSVQKERNRFIMIDNQLFGLYSIFGNGVIDGWTVSDNGFSDIKGISISITPGLGIINFIASQTTITGSINKLPTNSTFGVYAVLQGSTVQDRKISFIISQTDLSSEAAIQIATIVTLSNGIYSVDNDVRDLISFQQLIQEAIDEHRHRGTPTKIDLGEETKNQLPGSKIESIDAGKITSGLFNIDRIPIINHEDLDYRGLNTHAALDTFLETFSVTNKELLGEVASVNLLKTILFLKYMYADVDEHFINEIALIPGVSPNSFIDFNASTAHIDLINKCISGLPARTGQFTFVSWEDNTAFDNAYNKTDVLITNDTVTLPRAGSIIDEIENFETVTASNVDIPGFAKETVIREDSLSIKSDAGDSYKVEGEFGGKFDPRRKYRAVFTKTFDIPRVWTDFDQLVVNVKTVNAIHGPVYAYFVNETDSVASDSSTFTLLSNNHITSNADTSRSNFEELEFDISSENRENVTKFVIYTDDTDSDFLFYLDNLYVKKDNLVSKSGSITFRYASSVEVGFHAIFYEGTTLGDTDIQVRVKIANSTGLLTRAAWSRALRSGDVFAINGTHAEIQVQLIHDTNNGNISPTLDSVRLRLLVTSDTHGFDIRNSDDWSRGDLENISIEDDSSSYAHLEIDTPINMNGRSFSYADTVHEIDDINIAILGLSGSTMPISPAQAIDWDNNPVRKFDELHSVVRRFNRNYIIADKKNNRVIEMDSNGNIVRGFACTYTIDDKFYPMVSVYNPTNGVLTIVCSQKLNVLEIDITKISLYIGASELALDANDTILTGTDARHATNGQVVDIQLNTLKRSSLSGVSTDLYVNFVSGAFAETIEFGSTSQTLQGFYGIECFVGNVTYVSGIRHPIYASILENGNFIIGNSSVIFEADTTESVDTTESIPDVVELDPTTYAQAFTSDKVKFSDYTLGSIYEFSDSRFLVAGLVKRSSSLTPEMSGDDLKSNALTITAKINFRAAAIDALVEYRGTLALIDRTSGVAFYQYYSPDGIFAGDIDVCSDGKILVTESSFGVASGRIVRLDNFGNVTWAYGNDGTFNIINDTKCLSGDHVIVSV